MRTKIFLIMICLFMLASCSPAPTADKEAESVTSEEHGSGVEDAEQPIGEMPVIGAINTSFADLAYNSSFTDNFVYNPYDDCYYISVYGESAKPNIADAYPCDPPEIEQFYRINAQTKAVSKILGYWVKNLVYSDSYVYFLDPSDNSKIKRIKDGIIEEVFAPLELGEEYRYNYYNFDFHVENNLLYLIHDLDGVKVFDLDNMEEIKEMGLNYPRDIAAGVKYQIYNNVICAFSSTGFYWKEGAGKRNDFKNASGLIESYYRNNDVDFYSLWIESFIYDGHLLVMTSVPGRSDLFLIDPVANELELIASDERIMEAFSINDGIVYYISKDALFSYDIETQKTNMIISFLENDAESNDYSGYENLSSIRFSNNHCFVYMTGMKSYSYGRIAELDLESGELFYLTDYFDEKTNEITAIFGATFSFKYPNDYSVFIDYGSSGGTLISNSRKRICVIVNSLGMILDEALNEKASETVPKNRTYQGCPIYYLSEEIGEETWAYVVIKKGEIYVKILITGEAESVESNQGEILEIIKSIYIYEDN